MFWPFLSLIILGVVYIFFFSPNGYFAYQNALQEKAYLQQLIQELKEKKKSLKREESNLKSVDRAIKAISKKYLLFEEKVELLKFVGEKETAREFKRKYNLEYLRNSFAIGGSVFLLVVIFIAWRFSPSAEDETDS